MWLKHHFLGLIGRYVVFGSTMMPVIPKATLKSWFFWKLRMIQEWTAYWECKLSDESCWTSSAARQ